MLGKPRTSSMLADALSLTRVITPRLVACLDGDIFVELLRKVTLWNKKIMRLGGQRAEVRKGYHRGWLLQQPFASENFKFLLCTQLSLSICLFCDAF